MEATPVRVTLRLLLDGQEQQVYVVDVAPAPTREPASEIFKVAPYRFPTWTAPAEPTLVESGSFARFA